MRSTRRAALLAIALVLPASLAQAGDGQGYFLDAEASLSGGAVVASTESPGSLWYNPAGLAGVVRSHVSLSLSAGVIQFRHFENAITTAEPNGTISRNSLDGTRITLVSPAVTYVRQVRRSTMAFGLFTTRDDSLRVSGASSTDDGMGVRTVQQSTLDDLVIRYHLGGGFGFDPSSKLRLGFSTFVVYEGVDQQASITLGSTNDGTTPATAIGLTAASRDESVRYGVEATIGIQYRPIPRLSLGLHVRSPIVNLHESLDASVITQIGITGVEEDGTPVAFTTNSFDRSPRKAAGFGMLSAPRFTLGAAYRWSHGRVTLDVDYLPPVRSLQISRSADDPEYLTHSRTTWNVRAGALVDLSPAITFGAGLYTDRSTNGIPRTLGATRIHYYGATAGLRFESSIPTTNPGSGGRVVFGTTIAARYAVGLGSTGGYHVDLRSPADFGIEDTRRAGSVFHELHLYVGSTLTY